MLAMRHHKLDAPPQRASPVLLQPPARVAGTCCQWASDPPCVYCLARIGKFAYLRSSRQLRLESVSCCHASIESSECMKGLSLNLLLILPNLCNLWIQLIAMRAEQG